MRVLATAALALAVFSLAPASASAAGAARAKAGAEPAQMPAVSDAALRVLRWIGKTHDNGDLPFALIDKPNARLLLFDAQGKPLGEAPVLVGIAVGDDSSPGVGGKQLDEIGPAEKTTPAGRFLAKYGYAAGGKQVLWIDYADSVALHAVITTNKQERRLQRLTSPATDDNRITFGCVNVPTGFYGKNVRPLFQPKGGVVYVLPDVKPIEDVFPALRADAYL